MKNDPNEKSDLLTEDADLEALEDHLEEDELLDEEDPNSEDDPWEKQLRLDKQKSSTKYQIW